MNIKSYLTAEFSNKEHKRIFAKILIDKSSGCWEWQGAIDQQGYGLLWFKKRTERIHRVMYSAYVEPIPRGIKERRFNQIDHKCKNPKCCNPKHLQMITQKENVLKGESIVAINFRKNECKYGHVLVKEKIRNRRYCPTCDYNRHKVILSQKTN